MVLSLCARGTTSIISGANRAEGSDNNLGGGFNAKSTDVVVVVVNESVICRLHAAASEIASEASVGRPPVVLLFAMCLVGKGETERRQPIEDHFGVFSKFLF